MRAVKIWVAALYLAGCDPEAKQCHELMTSAQGIVNQVDSKSIPSLEQSLSAVSAAHAACDKAKLGTEREQLLKAKNELSAQLNLLKQRASRKKFQAPTPEELAQLVKSGDPNCPKGQAYKPKDSKSEIRCVGPQLADMNAEALRTYYGDRHFKVTSQENPAEVRAEMGSELYVFAFDKLSDAAPRCVTAYAAPGMSWQELVSRLTGTPPEHMKLDAPVKSGRGELALAVEHATDKPTVRLGRCGQNVAPP
ncbi:MAG TPA: hypothetical protein VHB79_21515 [Polyangiaceae bacterium]|nr:hypothetical protein [Polyangiaceae bacterium]